MAHRLPAGTRAPANGRVNSFAVCIVTPNSRYIGRSRPTCQWESASFDVSETPTKKYPARPGERAARVRSPQRLLLRFGAIVVLGVVEITVTVLVGRRKTLDQP